MPKDPRDSRAWRARRLEVLARDQWTCFYCMQPATTVDHVIPIKDGGDPLAYDNLVSSCITCNSRKGSRSQGSFLARTFAPPVFSVHMYPMQSEPMPDSPFKIKPNPNQ